MRDRDATSGEPASGDQPFCEATGLTDIDAYLRRGYVPEFNAPFSMAWVAEELIGQRTDRLMDALLIAWDGLMRRSQWHQWYEENIDPITRGEFLMLRVDDRASRRFSRGRDGGLRMFVPVTEMELVETDPSALNHYMTSLLCDFHVRLAETHGLPTVPEAGRI